MQINIEFSKTWTVDEVKEFLLNPNDKEYPDMPYDVYYELLACAELSNTLDLRMQDIRNKIEGEYI